MSSRRRFVATASLIFLLPVLARAQKPARIGLLSSGTDPKTPNPVWIAFLEQLNQLGYVEGHGVAIERRFAGGRQELLAGFAAELAQKHLDLIVATGDVESLLAKRTMPDTPLVMMLVQDPVGAGLIASLAHPGGNVTGLTTLAPELYAKRIELLKEFIPSTTRLGLLLNPDTAHAKYVLSNTATAARRLGIQVQTLAVRTPNDLDSVFSTAHSKHLQAVVVVTDGVSFNQRARIAELAAKYRLPTIYEIKEFVEAGGLISYGPSYTDLARRAAGYVDRILKGTKPADLPVEQPSRFELLINLKSAKALGLTIPPSILLRADRVIE